MHRLALLLVCSALATSPAWAMRAHEYIDADQRAMVALAHDHGTPVIAVEAPPHMPDVALAPSLPPREGTPLDTAAQQVASPVPEPTGYAMLGLGLLLLLLQPRGREGAAIAAEPDKQSHL